jgi:hypothetical protein
MNNLSLYELETASRLLKKEIDNRKKQGETLQGPFSENVDISIRCDGSISRGEDTEVTPTFKLAELLEPVLLRYAGTTKEPKEFLTAMEGVITATIQIGKDAVMSTVAEEHKALFNDIKERAKQTHYKTATKAPRAGNTVVAGTVEKLRDTVEA